MLDRPIFSSLSPPPEVVDAVRQVAGGGSLEWRRIGGGVSGAELWRCDVAGRPAFAVRRWPESVDAGVIATRRGWLTQMAEVTPLVARPQELLATDHRWEVANWVVGEPVGAEPSANDLASVACGLAEWHNVARRVDGHGGTSCTPLREGVEELRSSVTESSQLSTGGRWIDELRDINRRLPPAAEAARQTSEPFVGSSLPAQTVHGDARPEHFLLAGGRVVGVIDYGAIRQDTPLADVARFAAEVDPAGGDGRSAWFDAWERATGEPFDRPLMDALEAVAAVRTAANWRRWLAAGGPAGADPAAVRARLAVVRQRLDRLLA